MFNNKVINYIFIIWLIFLLKDIFYKSDIYIVDIQEKKYSDKIIYSYIDQNKLNFQNHGNSQNQEFSDDYKKFINTFLYDKKEFYKTFAEFNVLFFSEDKNISIDNTKIKNLKCYYKNSNFIDTMIRCNEHGGTPYKSDFFIKGQYPKILVVDNTKERLVFDFYLELSKFWNIRLMGLNQKNYEIEKSVFKLEKRDYTINFFLIKFLNLFLIYILINYFYFLVRFKNV